MANYHQEDEWTEARLMFATQLPKYFVQDDLNPQHLPAVSKDILSVIWDVRIEARKVFGISFHSTDEIVF